MAVFDDLAPCTYFDRWQEVLLSVGWLGADRSFAKGPVRTDFYAALINLLVNPWQPVALAGRATCDFCRFSGGPSTVTHRGHLVSLGAANLFVPGTEHVFVAPSMIAHYIDAHEYCPPLAFQDAVLRCPEMRSVPYLKALRQCGLRVGG